MCTFGFVIQCGTVQCALHSTEGLITINIIIIIIVGRYWPADLGWMVELANMSPSKGENKLASLDAELV